MRLVLDGQRQHRRRIPVTGQSQGAVVWDEDRRHPCRRREVYERPRDAGHRFGLPNRLARLRRDALHSRHGGRVFCAAPGRARRAVPSHRYSLPLLPDQPCFLPARSAGALSQNSNRTTLWVGGSRALDQHCKSKNTTESGKLEYCKHPTVPRLWQSCECTQARPTGGIHHMGNL